ncbi:MAG: hypothetical protein J6O49_19985 [Bacteroidaceae bacterium]|nr:hypothetical protein [Bacteroidaceae bacterium]
MKYTSILAGVFGLMALAACTNNDEVSMEQPKQVHTITVAFNKGANTRVQLSEFSVEEGFKGTWESTDKIGLIDEVGTRYTYTIEEIKDGGTVATFVLEGTDVPTNGTCKVVYPADWDGNLEGFDTQDIEYSTSTEKDGYVIKFNAEKAKQYLYALGDATCKDGVFTGQVTLTPIFNFIFIPSKFTIKNMEYWNFEEYLDEGGFWKNTVNLIGDNLFSKIEDFEGKMGKSYNLTIWDEETGEPVKVQVPVIDLQNFTARGHNEDVKGWWYECYNDLIFAFPVLPGKPVTNLKLVFDGVRCNVVNSDGSPAKFTEGGHVYVLTHEKSNLQFSEPK